VAKSHEATSFGSKDPSSNMLHFKAIFDSPLKNVVRRAPVPGGGALLKIGHSLAPVKIWGRSTPYGPKYGLPKNLILVGKH